MKVAFTILLNIGKLEEDYAKKTKLEIRNRF